MVSEEELNNVIIEIKLDVLQTVLKIVDINVQEHLDLYLHVQAYVEME